MTRAGEDLDLAEFRDIHRQWQERLRAVLETGEYPGLRLLGTDEDGGVRYLLWDMERKMWWRPNHLGYTHDVAEAGRYTQAVAINIALRAALGGLGRAAVIVAEGTVQ